MSTQAPLRILLVGDNEPTRSVLRLRLIGRGGAAFILEPCNTSTVQDTLRKAAQAHTRQRAQRS